MFLLTETLWIMCQAERAARRASVMQMATINTIFAVGLANMGVTLSTAQGITAVSNSSFLGAGKQTSLILQYRFLKQQGIAWEFRDVSGKEAARMSAYT